MTRNTNGKQSKGMKSVRGYRMKKQGGQSGGPGYNEKIDGKTHTKNPPR